MTRLFIEQPLASPRSANHVALIAYPVEGNKKIHQIQTPIPVLIAYITVGSKSHPSNLPSMLGIHAEYHVQ